MYIYIYIYTFILLRGQHDHGVRVRTLRLLQLHVLRNTMYTIYCICITSGYEQYARSIGVIAVP